MEKLYSLYDFIRNSEMLRGFMDEAGPYVLKAGFVFALLNCFFGYRLRKLWSCFFGLVLGVGAGLAAGFFLDLPLKLSLAGAALGGLLCTALAFLLYRIGMFFLCIGAVILTLFQLFPLPTFSTICGFVIFGITMGFLAVIQEHRIVICITAVCGGVGAAKLLLLMLSNSSTVFLILLSLLFSALGLVFQFKPWKDKDYWKREEDRSAQNRKRDKERRQNSRSARAAGKKAPARRPKDPRRCSGKQTAAASQHGYAGHAEGAGPAYGSSGPRRKAPAGQGAQSPQTAYGTSARQASAGYPGDEAAAPAAAFSHAPDTRFQTPPPAAPGAFSRDESYTVDLSQIRTEISREVQDIYHQKSMAGEAASASKNSSQSSSQSSPQSSSQSTSQSVSQPEDILAAQTQPNLHASPKRKPD